MLKNALFLKTAGKLAAALGTPPPDPQVVTLTQLTCCFRVLLIFLGIVKFTTYYLILERQLEGPLAKLAPSWLKPLVTPLSKTLSSAADGTNSRYSAFLCICVSFSLFCIGAQGNLATQLLHGCKRKEKKFIFEFCPPQLF